ncbi:MAG: NAD-dependent epimerase/dehydratase family protein [Planctomycetota bacterium]
MVKQNHHVKVIDNLSTGYMANLLHVIDEIEFVEADILDADALARTFQGVDTIFHKAALASVPYSVKYPLQVNDACVNGTLNVLNEAVKADVRRVVYAGTSACYGDRPFSANRETDTPMVISPYAVAKLAGEYYCQAFHHAYDLETVCLRYFNVFGPRQDPDSAYAAVIPLFINWLLAGKRPIVYGTGQQSRDFTYVGNVVAANLLAADAEGISGRSYNIADGRAITLLELIDQLKSELGVDTEPDFQPPRVGDILHSMADITAAYREFGYQPKFNFKQGISQSIEYYREIATQNV